MIPRRTGHWHDGIYRIGSLTTSWLSRKHAQTLLVEMPRLWSGSAKSHGSMASGRLTKLIALVGAIICAARSNEVDVAEVYPEEWKGQLDDRNVHKRIKDRLGLRYPTHVHDAVGMGLAIQGVL